MWAHLMLQMQHMGALNIELCVAQDVKGQLAELRGQVADLVAQNTRMEGLLQQIAER
jgi:hypothetical protein